MSNEVKNLIRLERKLFKPASIMLAEAFQNDPMFVNLIPDVTRRKDVMRSIFQFVLYSSKDCEIYTTSLRLEGLSQWVRSDKIGRTSFIRTLFGVPLVFRTGFKVIRIMQAVDTHSHSVHKRLAPFPHWYLSLLGVNPEYQGKGFASALMKSMLNRIDEDNLPCYLETETEKNVEMYKHFGFRVAEQFSIPGYSDWCLWAMIRDKASERMNVIPNSIS